MKKYKFDDVEIINALEKSLVVALPTETVFGFAIRYDSEIAYDRLCKLKERRPDKAIAIMCSEKFFKAHKKDFNISKGANRVIKKFLPGPLTVLLPSDNMPYQTHLGTSIVGIRIPSDKKLLNFLNKLEFALQVTSANKSQNPPLLSVDEIIREFDNEENLFGVVDGVCKSKIPTTVVDLSSDCPVIIREGEIKKEEIEKVFYRR